MFMAKTEKEEKVKKISEKEFNKTNYKRHRNFL